jgi:hypothetical protein
MGVSFMAYTNENYRTKKQLKEAVAAGKDVYCHHPGLGGDLTNFTGRVCLEGPHYPEPHRWYATAELKDGKIVKVS